MTRPDTLPQGARSLYGADLSGWTYAHGFYNSPDGRQTVYEGAVDWDALESKKYPDFSAQVLDWDPAPFESTIRFYCGPDEVLRFEPDGKIYVQGRYTTDDLEVVDALREVFKLPKVYRK